VATASAHQVAKNKEDFRMYEGVLAGSAGWPVHPAIL